MKALSIVELALFCALSAALSGCSSDRFSQSDNMTAATSANESAINDDMKNIINKDKSDGNADLQYLKTQLEEQQQRLEAMSSEQQALQDQLKRQTINLKIKPAVNANAGRAKQGTASTAYVAFLEEESQFTEVEILASKEISIIPNRESNIKLSIPQDSQFIAIKVGLRYTQKRSQLLIPLSSIDFDKSLILNIGACDINIIEGINPDLAPAFTTKLKYYQQPLVSCS